ncbi:MarR family transcriptional regulator [Micromonospora sp. M12]
MTSTRRTRLYEELSMASRRYLAAYVLFNQAIADHLGLHPTDVQFLSLLSAAPAPPTVREIADMTGLTTGSATRLVDRLERGGYVRRTPDQKDRRRVLVTRCRSASTVSRRSGSISVTPGRPSSTTTPTRSLR